MRVRTPRAKAHHSKKLQECRLCGRVSRALLEGLHGWYHPECLKKLAKR